MVRVVRAVGTVHILARGVDVQLEVVGICGGTMRGGGRLVSRMAYSYGK